MKFLYVVFIFAILQNRLITEIVSLQIHSKYIHSNILGEISELITDTEGRCSRLIRYDI